MKFSLIKAAPRMFRKEDACRYIGSPRLLDRMEKADPPWDSASRLAPQTNLYDVMELDACCDRLTRGEFPEPAQPATAN
jgi:hypothetical protein